MKPLRMCMVCRERKEKHDLIRIACPKGHSPVIDTEGTCSGRGAYVCPACVKQAQKRRILERAFSTPIDADVYRKLEQLPKEETYES